MTDQLDAPCADMSCTSRMSSCVRHIGSDSAPYGEMRAGPARGECYVICHIMFDALAPCLTLFSHAREVVLPFESG